VRHKGQCPTCGSRTRPVNLPDWFSLTKPPSGFKVGDRVMQAGRRSNKVVCPTGTVERTDKFGSVWWKPDYDPGGSEFKHSADLRLLPDGWEPQYAWDP